MGSFSKSEILFEMGCAGVSPYSNLSERAFWRTGVTTRSPLEAGDVYFPRFSINRKTKIMTAGSCFAQHIGRTLRQSGFSIIDTEPLPPAFPDSVALANGYRQYSARYGNIYTTKQLAQLLGEALLGTTPALPIWEKGDRLLDAQRPTIDPEGFDNPEDLMHHRKAHLNAIADAVAQTDLFVFTLGLTEAWIHRKTGTIYPTAPGTIAGHFDSDEFEFVNFSVNEVIEDFLAARKILRKKNRNIRFLLTVSPVPLTATYSGQHVEVASSYSKSVLRAACGMLTAQHTDIDYFPSYEIITSQNTRGAYFKSNQREISDKGVHAAMEAFTKAHGISSGTTPTQLQKRTKKPTDTDIACEEALLEAFVP